MPKKHLLVILFLFTIASVNAQCIPPTVTTDTALCVGSSLNLYDLVKDDGNISPNDMAWFYSSGLPVPTWELTITPANSVNYIFKYVCNGTHSINVNIKVSNHPTIEAMDDAIVCEGNNIQLNLKSLSEVDSIWWEDLGTGQIHANNSVITPYNAAAQTDYSINLIAYGKNNTCGITLQDPVTVTVKIPLNPSSLKVQNQYDFCTGETVDLTTLLYFTVNNNKGLSFDYYSGDNEVGSYSVTWQGVSNPNAYKVTSDVTLQAYVTAQLLVTNDCGNISRTFSNQPVSVSLKVQGSEPALSHESIGSINDYYPYIICEGDSVAITVSSGSCGIMDTVEWVSPAISHANRVYVSPTEWKYYWKPTTTTTFEANIKTKRITTDYQTTEVDNSKITINVKEYPQLVAITDTSACNNINQTIDLNGLLNKNSYIGSPDWGNVNPILINPTKSEIYHVKARATYRCQNMPDYNIEGDINVNINTLLPITAMADTTICLGSSVNLRGSSPGTIFWTNTLGGAAISPNQTPNSATKYYANVENACGINTDSVFVSVTPPPSITLRNDTIVCKNEPVLLYAVGFTGDSVLWQVNNQWQNIPSITVNPSQTTTYSAKAYKNGCDQMATVTVTIKPTPNLKAMDDLTICLGESVTLTAQSDAPVIWNVSNTTVTPTSDTAFYASSSNGTCTAYDTVYIKIALPPSVQAMDDLFVCYGEMVTLTAIGEGELTWNVPSTTFRATQTAEYIVTASNQGCTEASDNVVITVNDSLYIQPDALPRYKRGTAYDVKLETNAQGPSFTIIDGELPTGFMLTNSGSITGMAPNEGSLPKTEFTVEVTDVNNCKVGIEYLLTGDVFIPEIFSPNGDGYNDIFMEGDHVIIYNRFGVKLFEGDNGWDGTYKGKVMPPDSYFYIVTVINEEGQKEKKSGPISIIKR